MTAAVVVVFTICWSPLHTLALFSLLKEGSDNPEVSAEPSCSSFFFIHLSFFLIALCLCLSVFFIHTSCFSFTSSVNVSYSFVLLLSFFYPFCLFFIYLFFLLHLVTFSTSSLLVFLSLYIFIYFLLPFFLFSLYLSLASSSSFFTLINSILLVVNLSSYLNKFPSSISPPFSYHAFQGTGYSSGLSGVMKRGSITGRVDGDGQAISGSRSFFPSRFATK